MFVFSTEMRICNELGHNSELKLVMDSEQKIFGKESTPFLLKRVNELTGGNSLKSSKYTLQKMGTCNVHSCY